MSQKAGWVSQNPTVYPHLHQNMLKLPEINLQGLRRYHDLPSRAKARSRPSATPLAGILGLTISWAPGRAGTGGETFKLVCEIKYCKLNVVNSLGIWALIYDFDGVAYSNDGGFY